MPSSGHNLGAICMVDRKLVIVGGKDSATGKIHNKVTTYNSVSNMWTTYYPDMLNIRLKPGVFTYKDVIVMEGMGGESTLHNSFEVMKCHSDMQFLFICQFQCGTSHLQYVDATSL